MKTILDAIGNTPLFNLGDGIFTKAEFLNPSGSIKDRLALYLVTKAEKEGILKPGDTIVEATSGNTGNALSMVAAARGYKMIVLMPKGYTHERVKISKKYGATVRFIGDFEISKAQNEAITLGKRKGFFCPEQFDNEANVEENREWLGREIINQIPSGITIDALVQGVGTGGTLIGVGQALRKWHNPNLKVFAVEPSESQIIAHGEIRKHKIEGIADGIIPGIYERHQKEVADVIGVPEEKALAETQKLRRERGVFVGPSSGANLHACQKVRRIYPEIKTVLTFLCDRGEKYLSLSP